MRQELQDETEVFLFLDVFPLFLMIKALTINTLTARRVVALIPSFTCLMPASLPRLASTKPSHKMISKHATGPCGKRVNSHTLGILASAILKASFFRNNISSDACQARTVLGACTCCACVKCTHVTCVAHLTSAMCILARQIILQVSPRTPTHGPGKMRADHIFTSIALQRHCIFNRVWHGLATASQPDNLLRRRRRGRRTVRRGLCGVLSLLLLALLSVVGAVIITSRSWLLIAVLPIPLL
mmetsp:Transcript_14332/g.20867  ORF Transcript_14332/g.20867 Transcript_14332/m.20867 type:complete len:242 (+) Transcript_14332:62-787(+)